jgi:hypothetical protein
VTGDAAARVETDRRTERDTRSPNGVGWTPYRIDVRTVEAARTGVYRLVARWLERHRSSLLLELREATARFVAREQGQLGAQRFLTADHLDAYVAVVSTKLDEGQAAYDALDPVDPAPPPSGMYADDEVTEERYALAGALGFEPDGPVGDALDAARAVVDLFAGDRFGADFPGKRDAAIVRLGAALDDVDEAARR